MTQDDLAEGARSFTRALEMIADGDLVFDASAELHELLEALRKEALERRREVTGTFTLKLGFRVEPGGVVEVRPAIQTKRADRKLARGLLYLTAGANLTPENPRQQRLALHEVEMDDDDAHDVGENSAKEV